MDAERWEIARHLLERALDVPAENRPGVLSEACPDAELRKEVESLLEAEGRDPHFLTRGAAAYAPDLLTGDGAPDPNLDRRIGAYRTVRLLGTGGMGAVYLAERTDQFRQRVALKLLHPGLNSSLVGSRFLQERQILAALEHPNIVRLLDGGVTRDGSPYVVMEYVDGVAIDSYCASHDLPIPARLALFRSVCSGVQYAHRNLVVHRDLKSRNILVTADGIPKLVDFGIAKLLEPRAGEPSEVVTRTGFHVMTPEYASPEQVRGLPITTATDVYSLGVVLFELLTGRLPYRFETRSPSELERVICEQEAPRAREAAPAGRTIHRDLEKVVAKALEKDPQRRYQSVEQFSDDVDRFLRGLPVSARPPTSLYRAGRFVRRHRLAVVAAGLGVLLLVSSLGVTMREARVAREERARAERRFNDVRKLANAVLYEFHDEIASLPGATRARRLVADRAREYLDGLAAESGGDMKLESELAQAYLRLGRAQADTAGPNLGDGPAALTSYAAAVRIASDVLQAEPANLDARRARAAAWAARARVLMLQGKSEEGVASLRAAIDDDEALVRSLPDDVESRMQLASSLGTLGVVSGAFGFPSLGDIDAAEPLFRRSIASFGDILSRGPQNQQARISRASQMLHLGNLLFKGRGRPSAALPIWETARAELQTLDVRNPEVVTLISSLREMIGWAVVKRDPARALQEYRQAVDMMEGMAAADPSDARARMGLAITLAHAGIVQSEVPGQQRAALASLSHALQFGTELAPGEPRSVQLRIGEAEVHVRVARILAESGMTKGVRDRTASAVAVLKQIGDNTSVPNYLGSCAWALLHAEPRDLRDPEWALRYARTASAAAKGHNVEYLGLIAEAHFQAGRADQAAEAERSILSLIPPDSPDRAEYQRTLARYRSAVRR